ncbi:hypothetical protein [uncultured Fusobacterium sp.]|uniref:hypothetical protein n=1 Tax=uncultured Fusobacterium sp. TaxID=159267 RepID=UPI00265EB953|nr:hypothetical protein [uncultured Fusobacterium sp.]
MENKNIEMTNFLEDLRVGDIIFELENLKSVVENIEDDKLTKNELSGAVLIYLAEKYNREELIESLKNDDMDCLKEILSIEIEEVKESMNEKIKERYEDDPSVVDDIVGLIHKIGSYNVRMALDLITDDEIDKLDED